MLYASELVPPILDLRNICFELFPSLTDIRSYRRSVLLYVATFRREVVEYEIVDGAGVLLECDGEFVSRHRHVDGRVGAVE